MEGLATGRMLAISPLPVHAISSRNNGKTSSCLFVGRPRLVVLCCSKDDGVYNDNSDEVIRLRQENSELRASLVELSQSLASISAAVAQVSRAVQLVANAVDCGPLPLENGGPLPLEIGGPLPLENGTSVAAATDTPPETSEALVHSPSTSSAEVEDPVKDRLMTQNTIAHNLAYKIQQAFIQARIEGIGKPFQLAAEDFVTYCLEAHAMGIGLKELQLQLILLEGSLSGAFAMRDQRYSSAPIMNEESRVRSSWVRLVYTTLAEIKERRSRVGGENVDQERDQPDPSDGFVKELVTLAYEQGYDLERVKLEQNVAGPATSGAIKTMRQSTYLVLLTLQKTTEDAL